LLSRTVQLVTSLRSAKATSVRRHSGRTKFGRDEQRETGVKLDDETYVVATTDTLMRHREFEGKTTKGASHAAVKNKARSGRAPDVQVVPLHELDEAA
jgi:hypothetical protein